MSTTEQTHTRLWRDLGYHVTATVKDAGHGPYWMDVRVVETVDTGDDEGPPAFQVDDADPTPDPAEATAVL